MYPGLLVPFLIVVRAQLLSASQFISDYSRTPVQRPSLKRISIVDDPPSTAPAVNAVGFLSMISMLSLSPFLVERPCNAHEVSPTVSRQVA